MIGATAVLTDVKTGAKFLSRIDTGATTCSMHAEEVVIEGEDDKMSDNIGKKVRFRIVGREGDKHWIESKVVDTVRVKTSVDSERRYKVWMTLSYGDREKRVLVTLNDRSHMEYPLLVGRNFLRNDFVVDVSVKDD